MPPPPRVSADVATTAPRPRPLPCSTLFNSAKTNLNASDFLAAVEAVIGPQLAPVVAAQYPLSQYSTPWWALTQMLTDSQMVRRERAPAVAATSMPLAPPLPLPLVRPPTCSCARARTPARS